MVNIMHDPRLDAGPEKEHRWDSQQNFNNTYRLQYCITANSLVLISNQSIIKMSHLRMLGEGIWEHLTLYATFFCYLKMKN